MRAILNKDEVNSNGSLFTRILYFFNLYFQFHCTTGLGYRPMPEDPDNGALIWFQAKNHTNVQKWTRKIDDFLEGMHERWPFLIYNCFQN